VRAILSPHEAPTLLTIGPDAVLSPPVTRSWQALSGLNVCLFYTMDSLPDTFSSV
jgi:hypothetical protein